MDEKLGPNNVVDIGLVRSEVILYIVKFVLIGIDMKAFGVPSAAISNVHVTMHEHTCWKFHSNDVKSLIVSVSTPRGGGPGDIPDTIGGNNPLSICGTFSPVGSMSMDAIDEEEED